MKLPKLLLQAVLVPASAWGCMATAFAQTPAPPTSPLPTTQFEYDAHGNLTREISAPGVAGFGYSTRHAYDRLYRRISTSDPRGASASFNYDGLDRITKVTDRRSLATSYVRTGLGDIKQVTSPDTGTTARTYDVAGNLKTATRANGVTASWTHDALHRPVSVTFSASKQTPRTVSWSYDQTGSEFGHGIGRMTSTATADGSTSHSFGPRGEPLSITQRVLPAVGANAAAVSHTVRYEYEATGQVSRIVYPSGRSLAIAYLNGRPSALAIAGASGLPVPLIDNIRYRPFGGPVSWDWRQANGTRPHSRQFDSAGRVVRYPLGDLVRDLSYDAANRITAYTHRNAATGAASAALDQRFSYDELGRLTQATLTNSTWSYTYDASGNRTLSTLNGLGSAYTTARTSNRLSSVTNPARSLTYDATGNTVSDGTLYAATYSLEGNLSTLRIATATTTYAYNAFGHRMRKFSSTGASSTVFFVHDPSGRLLGEYAAQGQAIREYAWLGNELVATFSADPVNAQGTPLVFFIHTDHLGAPRVILDRNGQMRWRWLSEPFAVTAAETNPQGLGAFIFNIRLPGQYFDAESGLHYNLHRYYDPTLDRYTQSDPIGLAGGLNTYVYAQANPVSLIDPQGLAVYRSGSTYSDIPYAGRDWLIAQTSGDYITGWDTFDPSTVGDDFGCQQGSGGDGWWGQGEPDFGSPGGESPSQIDWGDIGRDIVWTALCPECRAIKAVAPLLVLARKAAKENRKFVDLTTPNRRRHILDGDATGGGHGAGRGASGKSEFPSGWSDDRVIDAISDVATDPRSTRSVGRGGRTVVEGVREGVNIRVIVGKNGEIVTGFPVGIPRNP